MLSRNPLVRASDRLEAAAITVAVFVILAAAACAGALGTIVHDASIRVCAEEAQTRHPVVATAVEDSRIMPASPLAAFTVNARWRVDGTDHAGELSSEEAVKAGDPLPIWVDVDGKPVRPPLPPSRAVTDAVSVAIVAWSTTVLTVAALVSRVQFDVRRMRDAQWEHDIRCLIGDDGGRTSSSH